MCFAFLFYNKANNDYIPRFNVWRDFECVLTNSTGSAFKQLVAIALGAGGMAEDALALQ